MKKECPIIKSTHKFLWWKWEAEYQDHDWAYKNDSERKCLKCGRSQMLIEEKDGYRYEDHALTWVYKL